MLLSRIIFGLCCLASALLSAPSLHAQTSSARAPVPIKTDRTLTVGESDMLDFDGMTAAAVGSPNVADIVPLSGHRLLISAKGVGQTTLFVFDRQGRHQIHLAVISAMADLGPVAAQIQAEIGLPGVTVRAIKDTIFLEGEVTGVVALQRASAIAGVYASKIRNLLAVLPMQPDPARTSLAQTYADLLTTSLQGAGIKVQIIDENTIALLGDYAPSPSDAEAETAETAAPKAHYHRSPVKPVAAEGDPGSGLGESGGAMGIDLKDTAPSRTESRLSPDPLDRMLQSLPPELRVIDLLNLAPRPARQILVRAKIIDIDRVAAKSLGVRWGTLDSVTARNGSTYEFQPQPILFGQQPAGGGEFNSGLLGGGKLQRILPFAAQLNLLISENKARILSEPSLMVLDGSSGSILVGGEIPIPVAQGSSGTNGISSSVTIQYKPYGVRLLVSAFVAGGNAVQMTVTPEVSELNYTNAVQISGFTIPALTVRRATSTLQMADGETLVIGGLYSNTASREVERIPLLSQIPVIGEFFKNTTTRKEENELLIIIQPQIVTPETPGARPPPLGSRENLPIVRPGVGRSDFDKDFPALQKGDR